MHNNTVIVHRNDVIATELQAGTKPLDVSFWFGWDGGQKGISSWNDNASMNDPPKRKVFCILCHRGVEGTRFAHGDAAS
jgi:hypothetical protein